MAIFQVLLQKVTTAGAEPRRPKEVDSVAFKHGRQRKHVPSDPGEAHCLPIGCCTAGNHSIGGCALDVGDGQRVKRSVLKGLHTPEMWTQLDAKGKSPCAMNGVVSPLAHRNVSFRGMATELALLSYA